MLNRDCPPESPKTAPYVPDDDTTDEESICHKCRQVDWESLPNFAESHRWRHLPIGTMLRYPRVTIRTIEANHEQLAISTPSCKICRILSILKPQCLDTAPWFIEAETLLNEGADGDPQLETEHGVVVTALHGHRKGDLSYCGSSYLVAIKRHVSGSRTITPKSIDYNRLKDLVQECVEGHGSECNNEAPVQLVPGLKVIDVSSRTVIQAPSGCRYVALSYVWGQKDVGSPEMNLQRPPPLIEDVISVTSSMGYQYLWIDRYCIPQNNDQDRYRMISRMNEVYSSASITIIDASGEDAQSGLPGVSRFARRLQQRVHIGNTTLLELRRGELELRTSKWATRGWTYQEGFFSRRRLIFTPSQVIVLCALNCAEESIYSLLGQDTRRSFNILGFRNLIRISSWTEDDVGFPFPRMPVVVQLMEYSKRNLTFQHDSLNAFLGVLNSYNRSSMPLTPDTLHISWGVFAQYTHQDQLCIRLDWYHVSSPQRRPEFPSWTWAGWGGPLQFTDRGIMLRRSGEEFSHLRYLNWQLYWNVGEYPWGNIWDLVDRQRRGQLSQQPRYTTQLHITCLVLPVGFKKVSVTRHQNERNTEIFIGDSVGGGASVFKFNRICLHEEAAALLQIWEGSHIAAKAFLDQQPEIDDRVVGLVFSGRHRSDSDKMTFGCLLARQRNQDLYERLGLIPYVLDYNIQCDGLPSVYDNESQSGGVFLDESGKVLDKIELSRRQWDSPFKGFGERRTIILV